MAVTFVLEIAAVSDYQNPTIQEIAGIVELLPWFPEDDFMIVDRVDSQAQDCGESYLQTFPQNIPVYAGLFVIEYRDGVAKRHYEGFIEAGAPLVEMFASYLNDDNLWRDAVV